MRSLPVPARGQGEVAGAHAWRTDVGQRSTRALSPCTSPLTHGFPLNLELVPKVPCFSHLHADLRAREEAWPPLDPLTSSPLHPSSTMGSPRTAAVTPTHPHLEARELAFKIKLRGPDQNPARVLAPPWLGGGSPCSHTGHLSVPALCPSPLSLPCTWQFQTIPPGPGASKRPSLSPAAVLTARSPCLQTQVEVLVVHSERRL